METILEGIHRVRREWQEVFSPELPHECKPPTKKPNLYIPGPNEVSVSVSPINLGEYKVITPPSPTPTSDPAPQSASEIKSPVATETEGSYEVFLYNRDSAQISAILSEFPTEALAVAEVEKLRKQGLPAFYATKGVHKNL
jgi:hypothetical protein